MHPDVHENLREVNFLAASQEELKKNGICPGTFTEGLFRFIGYGENTIFVTF
jgi:hypothetical protein